MQDIEVDILKDPFPHLILYNFYNDNDRFYRYFIGQKYFNKLWAKIFQNFS